MTKKTTGNTDTDVWYCNLKGETTMNNETQTVLNKLATHQKHYCRNLSVIIAKCKNTNNDFVYTDTCGKLKGYLDCLRGLCGLTGITDNEVELLYRYFTTADRSIEE